MKRAQFWIVLLAVTLYGVFSLAAYLRFPSDFSPARNWLSDLGSAVLNPRGAWLYNLGVVLTGLLLLLFFLSLSTWRMQNRRVQNAMVRTTQVFGVMGSAAMVMSAVYPIHMPQHGFWSVALYVLIGTAFGFSIAALRYDPKIPFWVLAVGGVTAVTDIFSGFLHESTAIEWVTVGMFLVYVFLLGWASTRLRAAQPQGGNLEKA